MPYVVCEDYPTNRARIHVDTCRYYGNRKRNPRSRIYWHGPFDSLEGAWAKVGDTGKRDVGECGHCVEPR